MSQPDQPARVSSDKPGATPVVTNATGPLPEQTQAQPQKEDPRDRVAKLEAELAEARAEASGQDTVRMKVEPPHESFSHANVTVRSDFAPVPAQLVPALMTAAADAGVTLTQEG